MYQRQLASCSVCISLTLMALLPASSWAQDPPTLPDTPVGEATEFVIGCLNGDIELDEALVAERFTPEFIAEVPASELIARHRSLWELFAHFTVVSFEATSDLEATGILADATGAYVQLHLALTEETHQLTLYSLRPAQWADPTLPTDWASFDEQLAEYAPQVSFLAAEIVDGALIEIHSVTPDNVLGSGSSFKLYVLGALAQAVSDGTVGWDDEIVVSSQGRTIGVAEGVAVMADGDLLSLRGHAELMISISDNVATDHLMLHLGRQLCERMLTELGHHDPDRTRPLLTTREFFQLKLAVTDEDFELYRALSIEEREAYLNDDIAGLDLGYATLLAGFWTAPRRLDTVEWFFSATDLCRALAALHQLAQSPTGGPILEILSINPGAVFNPDHWAFTGYKGGSEPGVMAGNWLLESHDGRLFTFSVIGNDPGVAIEVQPLIDLGTIAANILGDGL